MANPEHVKIVKQGEAAIAEWRASHPRERLDLSKADLSFADLIGTKLSGADLSFADLSFADLSFADLSFADLSGAKLSEAKLIKADLSFADLSRADLSGADLSFADLSRAKLIKADLSGADLSFADLVEANLSEADLSRAEFGATGIAGCDLHQARGLESAVHLAHSSTGIDTLINTFRGAGNRLTPELEAFFRGTGVPQELLAALPGILAEVRYCSCFIAYGEPDRTFAEKLVKGLRESGVSCWIYSMDAIPGERTWGEIGHKRREADKMVVLCSSQALVRLGVLKEIEEQIDEDRDKIIPVSLDDLWKKDGFLVMRDKRDLKPFLMELNYADFANLSYQEALARLLKALERKQEARG